MSHTELQKIADGMKALEPRFSVTQRYNPAHLNLDDSGEFTRLLLEAKAGADAELGGLNDFSIVLFRLISHQGSNHFPSLTDFKTAIAAVEGAANHTHRKLSKPAHTPQVTYGKSPYVSPTRIYELQIALTTNWDPKRLIRLLEELNLAHDRDMHMSTAMLARAVADHVPPIFNKTNFGEVASNHGGGASGGRSFKGSMQHLENSMKNIADSHLHVQIRKTEVLPTEPQVDFRQDLDVLLGEVVRLLNSP